MKIGIIGAGNIGGTLGQLWSAKGHQVTYGVREGSNAPGAKASIEQACSNSEVIVLAVPGNVARDAVAAAGDLADKIVIDCTNFSGDDSESGAQRIAGWATGARVVKSFNQAGWETLEKPDYDGQKAVMFVAGDDGEAREVVMQLGREIGLDMVDAGGLANARLLESLAELWIELAFRQGLGRGFAFGLLRR